MKIEKEVTVSRVGMDQATIDVRVVATARIIYSLSAVIEIPKSTRVSERPKSLLRKMLTEASHE